MPPPVFRFAPSPNGYLHLGHAYSALLSHDLARRAGGRLLLRIEDIDTARCRPEFEAVIVEDLAWLGLEWETPGGLIQMKLADGHQAIQPIGFGRTKYNPDLKRVDLVDVQYFPAECVNPPSGVKSIEWIKAGMPGAKCE